MGVDSSREGAKPQRGRVRMFGRLYTCWRGLLVSREDARKWDMPFPKTKLCCLVFLLLAALFIVLIAVVAGRKELATAFGWIVVMAMVIAVVIGLICGVLRRILSCLKRVLFRSHWVAYVRIYPAYLLAAIPAYLLGFCFAPAAGEYVVNFFMMTEWIALTNARGWGCNWLFCRMHCRMHYCLLQRTKEMVRDSRHERRLGLSFNHDGYWVLLWCSRCSYC